MGEGGGKAGGGCCCLDPFAFFLFFPFFFFFLGVWVLLEGREMRRVDECGAGCSLFFFVLGGDDGIGCFGFGLGDLVGWVF